jgi:hypothetical protein
MYVKATMLKAWKASYSNSRILETREEKNSSHSQRKNIESRRSSYKFQGVA